MEMNPNTIKNNKQKNETMKGKSLINRKLIMPGVIFYFGLLILTNGCGFSGNGAEEPVSSAARDTVAVQAVPVELRDIKIVKTYSGSLEGESQANIVAKISERIIEIHAEVGLMVEEGQTLIALDKSGASSQYYQAEASYENAKKNLARMKSLYQQGAISQQSLDGYQTSYDVAKANFEAAKSAVELTAPISGVITAVNVSMGDLTVPGAALITIAKINHMKIIFDVSEFEIQNLVPGQRVQIYSQFKPDLVIPGQIVQLAKSADVYTRSFEVKATFPNTRDFWFKPGMFCKVRIDLASARNVPAVPNSSIIVMSDTSRVFIIHHHRAFSRPVHTGLSNDSYTEILKGVRAGDTLVTQGMNNLQDSTFVVIVNSESDNSK
jgi:RND family efflux transporter MFP subunit